MFTINSTIYAFIEYFSQNLYISFFLAIASLAGLFVGIYAYPRKRLSYKYSTFSLVQNNINKLTNLQIFYKEQPIDNLSITNYVIWNSGNRSIRNSDIVPQDPLCISSNNNDTKILNIDIIKKNKVSTNTKLITSQNNHIVTFDYLDNKNGVIIQIIHTGNYFDILFNGDIIGGKVINEDFNNKKFWQIFSEPIFSIVNRILIIFMYSISISSYLLLLYLLIELLLLNPLSIKSFLILFLIFLILAGFYFVYKTHLRVPRSLKSYKSFSDDF